MLLDSLSSATPQLRTFVPDLQLLLHLFICSVAFVLVACCGLILCPKSHLPCPHTPGMRSPMLLLCMMRCCFPKSIQPDQYWNWCACHNRFICLGPSVGMNSWNHWSTSCTMVCAMTHTMVLRCLLFHVNATKVQARREAVVAFHVLAHRVARNANECWM
jgi:hypothetical protein